jgi:hypothetical protein
MTTALLIYLAALLFFFLGMWVYTHLKQRAKKGVRPPHQLAVCEFCHFAYLADSSKQVNQCPSCTLLNKENWYTVKKDVSS